MNTAVVILFLVVIVIGVALLIVMALTRKGATLLNQEKYRSDWLAITHAVTSDQASRELAIIKADKLLDQALRESGIAGQTMGERLKAAKTRFKSNDATWRAHKLRNQIAHETNVTVSPQQLHAAMGAFKQALTDLGAL